MSGRDVILGRLRDALGTDPAVPDIPRDYVTTSDLDAALVVDLFAERVDDYRATVHRCDADGLAGSLAAILTGAGSRRVLAPTGVDDAWFASLPSGIEVARDGPERSPADLDGFDVAVTAAAVGIADTGTIGLDASPDQGRRALTLVPDHHVCIVRSDQIVHTVAEGLARLDPLKALTLISGPSATSDIELDRVEGVHGPRRLDVVIVQL